MQHGVGLFLWVIEQWRALSNCKSATFWMQVSYLVGRRLACPATGVCSHILVSKEHQHSPSNRGTDWWTLKEDLLHFFFNLVDWHFAICSLRKNNFWWIYSYWEHFLKKVLKTVEAFCAVNLLSQNYIFKISGGFSFPELRYLTKNQEWKNMKNKIKHCTSPK